MSKDPRDERQSCDRNGDGPFVTDSNGEFVLVEGDRIRAPVKVKVRGFTTYEGDCCTLCGRLTCRGGCFK